MISKVSELFQLTGYNFVSGSQAQNRTSCLKKSDTPLLCTICKQFTHEFFHISDVFSPNFTNFNLFTSTDFVCSDCAELITDLSRKATGFFIHFDPDTKKCFTYDFKDSDKSSEEKTTKLKQFLLKPEKGFFVFCYSERPGQKHFLPYAKLNYSDGNIEDYLVTIGPEVIKINVEKLNAIHNASLSPKKKEKLPFHREYGFFKRFSWIFKAKQV